MHDWQKQELDRRKANLQNHPGSGLSWDEVKRRIRSRINLGSFDSKLSGIAEIAVSEAVQESKAGDAVEAGGNSRNANDPHLPIESDLGDLDPKLIDRKPPG